jgi:hypothetical protein
VIPFTFLLSCSALLWRMPGDSCTYAGRVALRNV